MSSAEKFARNVMSELKNNKEICSKRADNFLSWGEYHHEGGLKLLGMAGGITPIPNVYGTFPNVKVNRFVVN